MSVPSAADPLDPDTFPAECPLCHAPVASVSVCGTCGLDLAGTPGTPNAFRGPVLLLLVGVLGLCYLLTLGIVLLTR